jgi:hypothetical protein
MDVHCFIVWSDIWIVYGFDKYLYNLYNEELIKSARLQKKTYGSALVYSVWQ